MTVLTEQEIQISKERGVRERTGVSQTVKTVLAQLRSRVEVHRVTPDRLSDRLQRDAGIDEMDIEYRRIAKTPLIR